MKRDLSVLIIDADGELPLSVARCLAQHSDVKLHVFSRYSQTLLRSSKYVDSYYSEKVENDLQRLNKIRDAVKETGADIIMAVREPSISFMAEHRIELEKLAPIMPIPDLDIFNKVVDKWKLSQLLSDHDIPGPKTILYTDDSQFEKCLDQITFPALLKPARGGAGDQIKSFKMKEELIRFLKRNKKYENKFIVQSYINGFDIDCSVLAKDGKILAYTIQKGIILRKFAYSSGIEFVHHPLTLETAERIVSATNWTGVAHFDFRYDTEDKQVKLVDFNARFWNTVTGSLVVGVNFPYLAILTALGKKFPMPVYESGKFIMRQAVLKQIAKNITSKRKIRFKFSETELKYMFLDPKPEIKKMAGSAKKLIRGMLDIKIFHHAK
ncbi:MAG: ATP-grasp domain-containing protein [Calditrichaceae bacterium]